MATAPNQDDTLISIDSEHKAALDVIIADAYPFGISYEEVIDNMIEDYLLRENGRLGYVKGGLYYSC